MKTVAQAVTLFIVHVRFVSFKTPELAYSCLVLHQMHTNHQMKNCHEVSPAIGCFQLGVVSESISLPLL